MDEPFLESLSMSESPEDRAAGETEFVCATGQKGHLSV